jgi:hypothetical protein
MPLDTPDGSLRLEPARCRLCYTQLRDRIDKGQRLHWGLASAESMARLFHAARHIRTTAMSGIGSKYCYRLLILRMC